MSAKAAVAPGRILTDVELELMTILWDINSGTVREVMASLPRGRDLAYTSVSTMLRILHQKGFVDTRKEGRSHRYIPTVTRTHYESRDVRRTVGRLFGGNSLSLVRCLVRSDDLSAEDLQELRQLVEERLGE